ncbi:potassium transporter Trk [Dolosicoccus paucivorans]|uniref:Potassium transporter Trk n=1 Tax=Dolosicoccus paucivorans TaxID=84521 RepID=A0A2N6SN78_9LACT|nr:TrkA family potassium uptake protein [Dolosicoccus paucivorans]PMB84824.1 potassium transporter Trk [Dolosicoccus paucivorans]PMC58534.1 potassium transporter Trk [Dolosicoccus paucivorans]
MKVQTIGVLGLGVFGQTIARELSRYEYDVIAVDYKPDHVQAVADKVTHAAIGDLTDYEFLKDIGIEQCDLAIVATGGNLESAVLGVVNCKKLGVPQIISKARSTTFEEVLYEVGVDAVISPERDSGIRLASKILRNKIDEVLRLDPDTSLIEFFVPKEWAGKSLLELDLRKKYDLNIIGIRPEKGEPINSLIPVDEPLPTDGLIVAIATSHVFEKFDYLGYFDR